MVNDGPAPVPKQYAWADAKKALAIRSPSG
jgi:hypothetical protein